jgi:hypothetical protein
MPAASLDGDCRSLPGAPHPERRDRYRHRGDEPATAIEPLKPGGGIQSLSP